MLELLLVLWRLLLALWRRFAPANGPAKALRAHQASAHRQQRPAMLHAPSSAADASSPSLLGACEATLHLPRDTTRAGKRSRHRRPSPCARYTCILPADLPADVLERLATCPALDAPARLALFRTCHALARLAFVHAPERTVTRHGEDDDQEDVQAGAYAALGQLLDRWAPEDLHFELLDCAPSKPPPLSVRRHVTRLSLILRDTPAPPDWDWVGWLGGGTWPRLQHLTWDSGGDEPAPGRKLPRPIPTLRKLTLAQSDYMETRYEVLEPLLRLASGPHMEELEWNSFHESGCSDGLEVALRRLRRLTRVRTNSLRPVGDVMRLLEHPTVRHVELSDGLSWDWPDLSGWRCAWRTFAVGTCDLRLIASKFPGAKVSECVVVGGRFMHYGDELDSYREGVDGWGQRARTPRQQDRPAPRSKGPQQLGGIGTDPGRHVRRGALIDASARPNSLLRIHAGLELLERLQAQGKLTVLRQDPRLGNQEWGLSRSQGLGLVVAPEQFLPRVGQQCSIRPRTHADRPPNTC